MHCIYIWPPNGLQWIQLCCCCPLQFVIRTHTRVHARTHANTHTHISHIDKDTAKNKTVFISVWISYAEWINDHQRNIIKCYTNCVLVRMYFCMRLTLKTSCLWDVSMTIRYFCFFFRFDDEQIVHLNGKQIFMKINRNARALYELMIAH